MMLFGEKYTEKCKHEKMLVDFFKWKKNSFSLNNFSFAAIFLKILQFFNFLRFKRTSIELNEIYNCSLRILISTSKSNCFYQLTAIFIKLNALFEY